MEQFSHDLTLALEETSRCGGVRAARFGVRRRTRSTGNLPCAPQPTEDSSSSPADGGNIMTNGIGNSVCGGGGGVGGEAVGGAAGNSILSDSDDRPELKLSIKSRPICPFESDSFNENSPARPNTRRKRKFKRMAVEYETTPSTPGNSIVSSTMLPITGTSVMKKRVLKHTSQENFRANLFFCGKRKRSHRDRYYEQHSSSVPRQRDLYTTKNSYSEYRSRNRSFSNTYNKSTNERILPLHNSIVSKIEKLSLDSKCSSRSTAETSTNAMINSLASIAAATRIKNNISGGGSGGGGFPFGACLLEQSNHRINDPSSSASSSAAAASLALNSINKDLSLFKLHQPLIMANNNIINNNNNNNNNQQINNSHRQQGSNNQMNSFITTNVVAPTSIRPLPSTSTAVNKLMAHKSDSFESTFTPTNTHLNEQSQLAVVSSGGGIGGGGSGSNIGNCFSGIGKDLPFHSFDVVGGGDGGVGKSSIKSATLPVTIGGGNNNRNSNTIDGVLLKNLSISSSTQRFGGEKVNKEQFGTGCGGGGIGVGGACSSGGNGSSSRHKHKQSKRLQIQKNLQQLQFEDPNGMDCASLNEFLSSSSLSSSDSEAAETNESDREGDDELTDWPGNEAMVNFASKNDFKRAKPRSGGSGGCGVCGITGGTSSCASSAGKSNNLMTRLKSDDLCQDDDTLMSADEIFVSSSPSGGGGCGGGSRHSNELNNSQNLHHHHHYHHHPQPPNTLNLNVKYSPGSSLATSSGIMPLKSIDLISKSTMPIDILSRTVSTVGGGGGGGSSSVGGISSTADSVAISTIVNSTLGGSGESIGGIVNRDSGGTLLPMRNQIESEMSGETSNHFLSSPNTNEIREIRAGCRRIRNERPGFTILASVNEEISKFLQDARQEELQIPDTDEKEHEKLINLAKLYSLNLQVENGFAVLRKTSNTTQSVEIDHSSMSKRLLSDFKRRCYGDTGSSDAVSGAVGGACIGGVNEDPEDCSGMTS